MSDGLDVMFSDIEKKVKSDLQTISTKVKADFFKKASEVVLMYYSNYDPKEASWPRGYNRTYNLQNNVINDNVSFRALNGNDYGAWIEFTPATMYDYYDNGDRHIIVDSFMSGIHGKPSVQVDSPSPMAIMDNFQKGYKSTLDGYFASLGYRIK